MGGSMLAGRVFLALGCDISKRSDLTDIGLGIVNESRGGVLEGVLEGGLPKRCDGVIGSEA